MNSMPLRPRDAAAAKRQMNPCFIRTEIELKRQFTRHFAIEEYVDPPPTESTRAQTLARRRMLQRKIDGACTQQNTLDPLAAAAAKRQADPRFKRAEYEVEQECTRVLGAEYYVGPSPMETSDITSRRRKKMRMDILQVLNPKEKAEGTGQFKLGSFDDAEVINVTGILLGSCGNPLKPINITGESLRGLVDASTGGRKGLQMKREINVFRPRKSGEPFVDVQNPDLSAWDKARGEFGSVDIEDILKISNGFITFDKRPEMKKFKVTGEGGKPSYANGSIFGAWYAGDIEDNSHCFDVPLEPSSRQCKRDNLLSAEIHINGRMVTTLGESDSTTSAPMIKDGKEYRKVEHCWNSLHWTPLLLVVVEYGPLGSPLGSEYDSDVNVEPDADEFEEDPKPYYDLLMYKKDIKVAFAELIFDNNVLKKGGTLHHIALRDCNDDSNEEQSSCSG